MSIKELISSAPPPEKVSDVPKKPNWKKIEAALKVSLPGDYKEFVVTYGTGVLCNFLIVCNPFSSQEGFGLLPFVTLMSTTLAQLKDTEGDKQVPFNIHPDRPGLLAWGGDENGNGLYWFTKGRPEAWPCVVGEARGKRWERFDLPMTSFLGKILRKEIRCKIWPSSFPGRKPCGFQPYG